MNMLPEAVNDGLVYSDLIKKYENIFMKVNGWGRFARADLKRNGIHGNRLGGPDYVAKFEQMLDRKSSLDPNVRCFPEISVCTSVLRVLVGRCLVPGYDKRSSILGYIFFVRGNESGALCRGTRGETHLNGGVLRLGKVVANVYKLSLKGKFSKQPLLRPSSSSTSASSHE